MPDRSAADDSEQHFAWWLEDRLRGARHDALETSQLARFLDDAKAGGLDVSWESLYHWAVVSPTLARRGLFLPPVYVVEFLSGSLSQEKRKRLLDPWAAGGFLAASLLRQGAAEVAVAVARQEIEGLEALLPKCRALDLIHGDPLETLGADLGPFEALVLCAVNGYEDGSPRGAV